MKIVRVEFLNGLLKDLCLVEGSKYCLAVSSMSGERILWSGVVVETLEISKNTNKCLSS